MNYCYRELGKLNGALFIHGHSMDENDKHIFDRIKSSSLRKIFVSLFGDECSDSNTRTKANARAYLEGIDKEVTFYDAESAPVWG